MKNVLSIPLWLIALCVLVCSPAAAQNYAKKLKNAKGIEVTYQSSYKGKVRPGGALLTIVGQQEALSEIPAPEEAAAAEASKEPQLKTAAYVDYAALKSYKRAELPDGRIISSATPFVLGEGFKELRSEKLLGLNCKVVRTMINSNTIDVWYTTDLAFRGTPQPHVGVPDGLVLKVVRNGDMIQEATAIKAVKKPAAVLPATWGTQMEASDYQYTINQSGVITVNVFDQEKIAFTGAKLPETLEAGKVYQAAGGTVILKKVKLPESAKGRSVFAEVVQYSKGDAYDRTGSVFMIPTGKAQSFLDALRNLNSVPGFRSGDTDYHGLVSTAGYDVPVELMRFFTGFGVRQFNHNKVPGQTWGDSVGYKTDVTLLSSELEGGEVWVGAYIGNWDANGHRVSLRLKYYPEEERKPVKALPLFNTVNYLEQAGQPYPIFMLNDSLTVKFTLTEAAPLARLVYTTTGHGGWGGGDEFNPKPNTIWLDGQRVITFVPWRDDCATYRNNNPCSGNFSNGLSSSDLSRSNWCPGTVTNPDYIYLGDLKPGEHTLSVKIPQGAPEGGSNSYWCISGTLIY